MTQDAIDPSRSRLERDLLGKEFLNGERSGAWRGATLTWPYLDIEIAVGEYDYIALHIRVDNYPSTPPAGVLWEPATQDVLPFDRWPTGGTAQLVWRHDWSPGNQNAPYMACDRVGLTTHPDWAISHPDRAWNPSRTIAFYLAEVHREMTNGFMPVSAHHV